MRKRALLALPATGALLWALGTGWIAYPTTADLELPAPLRAFQSGDVSAERYGKDFSPLVGGFRSQVYRSFCGPASVATVLRGFGVPQADQISLFPSLRTKLNTFYTGMSLAELGELARSVGLRTELVYADTLSLETFRERLKENLGREGDFVVVNYDRRVLRQSGAGHISPVAAYDAARDAFLVLDQAAYRYPFTWVPTGLLYAAVRTRDGEQFRGVLFIHGYDPTD